MAAEPPLPSDAWFCAMAITRAGGSGGASTKRKNLPSTRIDAQGAKKKIAKAARASSLAKGKHPDYRTRIYRSKDPLHTLRMLNSSESDSAAASNASASAPFSLVAITGPFPDEKASMIFEGIWRNKCRGVKSRIHWGRRLADYFRLRWWMTPEALFNFNHLGFRHEENGDVYLFIKQLQNQSRATP